MRVLIHRFCLALVLFAPWPPAHADDLRGSHIAFVTDNGVRYTINVLKDGRILMFAQDTTCLAGRSGTEARLGGSQTFVSKCRKANMNSCGASGRERCKTNVPALGESVASWDGAVLKLKVTVRFNFDTGEVRFTDDWSIAINGATCSGQNRFANTFGSGVKTIAGCRVAAGLQT